MNKLFLQALKIAPVLFAAFLFAPGANAQSAPAEKESVNDTLEQINNYQDLEQNGSLSQVTNVNQLRDVSPTDWAYEALRSLVDRYGCIAGFPNQTYRGEQALTRYEFAAGLNSCLNQIERLIASQGAVSQEDLDTINRLNQEFEAELATLGGRVDELESRTAVLEDSQFSTTTKLKGEAIFAVSDAFGGGTEDTTVAGVNVPGQDDFEAETTLSSRVRLNFDTSFFGEDRLRTRLEGGNFTALDDAVTGTDSTRLGFDTGGDFNIEVSDLHYRFPVTERVTAWVGARGLDLDDIFETGNSTLSESGTGALSRFDRYNPLLFRGTDGAGAAVNVDIIPDKVGLNLGYLTDDGATGSASPSPEEGLFNGSFSAGAQLEVSPFKALNLSAMYVRNYQSAGNVSQAGGTTSGLAEQPFGENTDTVANKIGLGASFNVGESIVLGANGGYADVEGLVGGDDNNQTGEIWTWGANLSFLDLVKEGSQLSLAGGLLPRFGSDTAGLQGDQDSSYLLEALYKFPLNDNISLTPGAYVVLNPDGDSANDPVYVGVLRSTFEF